MAQQVPLHLEVLMMKIYIVEERSGIAHPETLETWFFTTLPLAQQWAEELRNLQIRYPDPKDLIVSGPHEAEVHDTPLYISAEQESRLASLWKIHQNLTKTLDALRK